MCCVRGAGLGMAAGPNPGQKRAPSWVPTPTGTGVSRAAGMDGRRMEKHFPLSLAAVPLHSWDGAALGTQPCSQPWSLPLNKRGARIEASPCVPCHTPPTGDSRNWGATPSSGYHPPSAAPGWIFRSCEEEQTNKHPDPPAAPQCQRRNKTLQRRALE